VLLSVNSLFLPADIEMQSGPIEYIVEPPEISLLLFASTKIQVKGLDMRPDAQSRRCLLVITAAPLAVTTEGYIGQGRSRVARYRITTGLAIIVMLALIPASAHAGPCSDDIAQFQQTVRQSAGDPDAGLMAPQSVDAQLGHQPTPGSLKRAKDRLHAEFSARMARAERLDKRGDREGCMRALAAAKRMYTP
jgi:hypothetical protein